MAILLLLVLNIEADAKWHLKKDKDDIKVYTRNVDGSSFLEFKAIMEVNNADLKQVLDVILDVENYDLLYADCINPVLLEKRGEYFDIHYIQTKGPFTVRDRDGIYKQTTEVNSEGNYAIVRLEPLPDYIEEKKNIVRMREGTGFWELIESDSNTVTITYQFHGEPGGNIPAVLANQFVVSHPFNTMRNLKLRLVNDK
ncbi:SRPBCC family protein [Maribellus mangrovi]|uniref:SRPBCC family protein n=1 Tax=Maribellus mangrovi TaxID=3133146 RepID=UPI0030EED89E